MCADEVVLTFGTIGYVELLMVSGVSPQQHLRDVGVGVALDLPKVGCAQRARSSPITECECGSGCTRVASKYPVRRGVVLPRLRRWQNFKDPSQSTVAGAGRACQGVLEEFVDIVLGISMTPTTVGLVLIEGESADGLTV